MIEDQNNIPELVRALNELGSYASDVGIFGESGAKYVMIGTVHEFGVEITVTPKMRAYLHSQGLHLRDSTKTIKIPERSFMRNGLTQFEKILPSVTTRALDDMFIGELEPLGVYERIGIVAESTIKKALVDRKEPALHPFTISRRSKHSTQPLVDEGGLLQRITHMTVKRGGD